VFEQPFEEIVRQCVEVGLVQGENLSVDGGFVEAGLAGVVIERGRKTIAANLWGPAGKQHPFPYALIFPQDEHERLLIDHLAEAGVQVERRRELVDFEDANGRVLARLTGGDGTPEKCEAAYIAGCDVAHSTVREALGIGFPGGVYDHLFYAADVVEFPEASL
jgi:2-polyprenyl-6-methoxyphenol hydroxylase-like FAD-dependent oxidoreductase